MKGPQAWDLNDRSRGRARGGGPWYEPAVTRDEEIQAIVELGRRTRAKLPRGLWIAAAIVGVICATGLVVALLGAAGPAAHQVPRPSPSGAGFGTGLAIGAAAGLAIGFALARQRRDHSSRRRP